MSVETVREYLKKWDRDRDILELKTSTATVALAAEAVGVIPARIAKTLSFQNGSGTMLIVTAGDAKIDNKNFKERFGFKARMLTADEALNNTGFAVGGVCPFGLPDGIAVYLDESLRRFETVFPACGSSNSAIELHLDELEQYSGSLGWVDVCKDWREA